ncbi:MAG: hypothetical protein MAG431_01851 [Chloroflexi bacterium]|nr:hypothetical protein [Chloroflexota bacterium]
MATKEELLQWLTESHQKIELLVSQIDKDRKIYTDWTIREVLAHFTGWDDAVIASLKSHASGGIPETVAERGVDAYNAATVSERETLDFEHIYKEWQHTHEQLKITIRDLPTEKMEEEIVYPWGQKGSVENLVRGLTAEHEQRHIEDIEAIVESEE